MIKNKAKLLGRLDPGDVTFVETTKEEHRHDQQAIVTSGSNMLGAGKIKTTLITGVGKDDNIYYLIRIERLGEVS